MLLPVKSKNPPESIPIATCCLIALNVIIYCGTSNGFRIHKEVLDQFGEKGSHLSVLTLLSSMFLHAEPLHLLGNMWFLYLFGFAVEGRLRTLKFLVVYLGSGICGTLLHHFTFGQAHPDMPLIGASGAIMGVVGAALYLFPFAKVQFFWSWGLRFSAGFIDIPMWGVGLYYLGFDILFAVIGASVGGDGVAHLAHIGGAVSGALLCMMFLPRRDNAAASEAKATLSDTKDLRTLSHIELSDLHKSNPDDTLVVLNWMSVSLRSNRLNDECTQAFMKALPKMMREQPAPSVAQVVANLSAINPCILPASLVDLAGRLEREGDPPFALRLYDQALRDTRATEADQVAALYRSGMIYEVTIGNLQTASAWYEELIHRYPMNPMTDQAKNRLTAMNARH